MGEHSELGDSLTNFRYVPSLNGLRALAVLAVVVSHALGSSLQGGKSGVLVFFALSGYLITNILLKERTNTGAVSLKNFYIRRALRLFPAMVIASAAYATMAVALDGYLPGSATLDALPAGIFYFLNWYNIASDSGVGLIGHYWSLSVEEQFYFIWPFLALVSYRINKVRGVMWVSLAGALASYALKWAFAASPHRQTGTDFAADALLVGCALACAMALYPSRVAAASKLLFWPGATGILLALVLGDSSGNATEYEAALFSRLWWPVCGLGACALIAACVSGCLPRWVHRVLVCTPLAYVGKISYGVYLYHMLFLAGLTIAFPDRGIQDVLRIGLATMLSLLFAALSFEYVEKRFLAMKPPHKEPLAPVTRAKAQG